MQKNQGLTLDRNTDSSKSKRITAATSTMTQPEELIFFWLTEYTQATIELGLHPAISDSHLSKYRI